jgi:cell division protein FtsB
MAAPNNRRRLVDISEWKESTRDKATPIAIFGVLIFAAFMLARPLQIWFTERQAIADLQAQVAQAKSDLNHMKSERARWEDPVYIRAQARDRLYYVMPGEVSYLVMGNNGLNSSDVSGTLGAKLADRRNTTTISKSILQTKNNWMDNMVESVLRSGIEEPVKASN